MHPRSIARFVAAVSIAATGFAFAGPDIDEATVSRPDAGATPTTARKAKGSGSVTQASGTTSLGLVSGDVVDMFLVYVPNTNAFSASTVGGASFDTVLWLFAVSTDGAGNPIEARAMSANDNINSTTTDSYVIFPAPPATSGAWPPGIYAIAITPAGVAPYSLNASSALVQLFNYSSTGLMAPVFGVNQPVEYWGGAPTSAGSYSISLQGATFISSSGTADCGVYGSGDCFTAHPSGKGCEDETCCTLVCDLDPFCCRTSWDSVCAEMAVQNCVRCNACPEDECPADLNDDGSVDGADLGDLLSRWGSCY